MSAIFLRFKFSGWAAAVVVALAGIIVLFWADPSRRAIFPSCPFHRLTGLNCPGCGGLRATHHLLHGRIATALHHNLLVVVAPPFLLLAGAGWRMNRKKNNGRQAASYGGDRPGNEADASTQTRLRAEKEKRDLPHQAAGSGVGNTKYWPGWIVALVALLVLFGVLRNVPHPAFAWMSP